MATSTVTPAVSAGALAQPSGFGDSLGVAFGGITLAWGSTVAAPPVAAAVLANDGTGTATLAP